MMEENKEESKGLDFRDIQRQFEKGSLHKNTMNPNPIFQLEKWLCDARDNQCLDYTSMALATASPDGQPSVRIVSLKLLWQDGLYFFSNYRSRKGKELAINNKAAILFYWPTMDRQVKIDGNISKVSNEISEQYFNSRPLENRISALISQQSREIESKKALEAQWIEELNKWKDKEPARPDGWGGFRLKPTRIEFWQGGKYQLHDRIAYRLVAGNWVMARLAP